MTSCAIRAQPTCARRCGIRQASYLSRRLTLLLNLMWVTYFFLIGAANLYVALSFSQEVWGKFRIFGIYGALLVFMVVQGVFVYRHMQHDPQAAKGGD